MTSPRWSELVVDVARLVRRDNIAELKRRPTDKSEAFVISEKVTAQDMTVTTAGVEDGTDISVEAELRSTIRGIEATLKANSRWVGECRRCLDDVSEPIEIDTTIMFLPESELSGSVSADDADAYPIVDERVDLGEVVREELMLALPLTPLCADDCDGADPDRFPAALVADSDEDDEDDPGIDPRWAGLSALTFDED